MRNFHLPLPDETYDKLRAEAARTNMPATVLARDAIALWLKQQKRKALHSAIAAYAAEQAGTSFDVDADLEAAGVEHLMERGKADE